MGTIKKYDIKILNLYKPNYGPSNFIKKYTSKIKDTY